ncbi:endo-beta-N-acetylglucosaminidase H [Chryseobacterium daecheongense]|uniref:Secreted protein (Por secretion system target) n=1 Tax=Chryseobacterium daecheongense TaxID=192389 RepID=A0A3N0VSX1_9FLAO|nr:endo-beta-N-acetylglucosaminidase H [Chryseobacterium daecheongense]ROH95864.1 T9SS C-terminal target domain-containing protein [Chryseobacterium daecheongense]TDX91741.1 putative secreted protein (Por secretion system target) [Chryseobacterium daecheongense]
MKKMKLFSLLAILFMYGSLCAQGNNPKGICYVEVNNNNILNAGSYKLQTSNKYLFDVVNIFAANINYDTSRGRAYLYSNNNVTKVLTNAQTYIKPLQDKGMKVLLTILGNHQGAGICNFPTREAAKDFALQLAHTVNTYGLDGIDFDDEYSDYGNNGTGQPNSSSFVMLVQELRALLPDKIISFYYYGPASSRLSWNGFRVGDYINYSWNAMYGTFSAPNVPPLTNAQISPAAVWLGNTSNSTTTSLATQTKNGSYGLFLWYDLHGTNEATQLSAGTQTLYGEQTVLSTPLQSWSQGTNCDAPIGLLANNLNGTSAKLNWTAVGTNTYDVDYKLATSSTWINAATATAATSITISGLTANTEYDWRIRTNCSVKSTYMFAPRFNSGTGVVPPTGSYSLSLDGSSESGSAGSLNLNGSALSFEGWIKPASFKSGFPYISSIMGTEVSDSNSALLRLGDGNLANNKLQFVLSINNVQQKLASNTALNANTWYHVAATYDGATMKIYINGVLDASKSQTGSVNSSGAFNVGYSYNISRNFNGKIDEVRVWKRALSQTEISQNTCNVTLPATSLTAYWKFNEGSGTSVQDHSGNGSALALTGVDNTNWSTDVACTTSTQKGLVTTESQNQKALDEQTIKRQIKLYPNPVSRSSQLMISVPAEFNKGKLTVYSLSGSVIETQILNVGDNQYNPSKLSTGNYIIQFESQNGSLKQVERFIIK